MADSNPASSGAQQQDQIDDIMDVARERDIDADIRDQVADQKDLEAAQAGNGQEDFAARTDSAANRMDAKIDRIAARRDREALQRAVRADWPIDADE